MAKTIKQQYLDFEEYIRQGEPDKKEKAGYWQTATSRGGTCGGTCGGTYGGCQIGLHFLLV